MFQPYKQSKKMFVCVKANLEIVSRIMTSTCFVINLFASDNRKTIKLLFSIIFFPNSSCLNFPTINWDYLYLMGLLHNWHLVVEYETNTQVILLIYKWKYERKSERISLFHYKKATFIDFGLKCILLYYWYFSCRFIIFPIIVCDWNGFLRQVMQMR